MDGVQYAFDGFSRNAARASNGNFKHRAFIPNELFFKSEKGIIPLFEKYNLSHLNILSLHTSEMILAAVKKKLGIGYVIENMINLESDLKILKLDERLPSVKINLIYNPKYLTTTPRRFIEMYIDKSINK